MSKSFELWLSKYLGEKEADVQLLVENRTGIEFLITWSIF